MSSLTDRCRQAFRNLRTVYQIKRRLSIEIIHFFLTLQDSCKFLETECSVYTKFRTSAAVRSMKYLNILGIEIVHDSAIC